MQISAEKAINLLRLMLKIRLFEDKIVAEYPNQQMKTPVHLSIGQEAAAAGVVAALTNDDLIFSTHRNHGHYIAKGASMKALTAELYGKATGCAKGKGGSMHFTDTDKGCMGTTAIVGASIPLGVGAALAIKMKKQNNISVSFFGDGASDEGVLQESLNFAALHKLPVLFACENNFYATNSNSRVRHANPSIADRAEAFLIPNQTVDGNNVEEVYGSALKAVEHIKSGKGPYFLECLTYRWKGHVGPEADWQKGCRPKEELDHWLGKDPVAFYTDSLMQRGLITEETVAKIKTEIKTEIKEAWDFALQSPYPDTKDLLADVYHKAAFKGVN